MADICMVWGLLAASGALAMPAAAANPRPPAEVGNPVPSEPEAGRPAAVAAGPPHAVEGHFGFSQPLQVLDGPAFQLAVGWRVGLSAQTWLMGEAGAIRTAQTALMSYTPAPGGSAALRADVLQWTVPMLVGGGVQLSGSTSDGVSLALLGGVALGHTRTLVGPPASGKPQRLAHSTIDPLVRARLEWAWAVRPGSLTAGAGWQQHFRVGPVLQPDIRVTGPFVEAGWRIEF